MTELTGGTVKDDDKELIEAKNYTNYVAYDLAAVLADGETATVSIPVPAEWNAAEDKLIGISVEDGALKEIKGNYSDGIYTFEVSHFSAKGVALTAEIVEIGEADWEQIKKPTGGTTTYTYTKATAITAGEEYVIVGNNNEVALMDNNGSMKAQTVTITEKTMTSETELTKWKFSGSNSGTVYNGTRYLCYRYGSFNLNTNQSSTLTFINNEAKQIFDNVFIAQEKDIYFL